jgi:hypothetical protein
MLRIELRRSAAIWVAVASFPALLSYGAIGQGLSVIAADQRNNLTSVMAFALALGAWQANRDRRSRIGELVASTPRPQWRRLVPIATALGITAFLGSFVCFAALTGYGIATGAYLPPVTVPFALVTALYLVAATWFGLAIGSLLPSRLTPPLVFVLGALVLSFLGFSFDHEGGPGQPPGGATLLLPGNSSIGHMRTYSWGVVLAEALFVVALAAAGLVFYVAHRYFRLAAGALVALGLAASLPILPRYADQALVLDRGAAALVCTPDAPRVCVRRVHHSTLSGLRGPGREALAILSAKLPQAPTSVVEMGETPGRPTSPPPPQADTLYTWTPYDDGGRVALAPRDVVWHLLLGAGTQPCVTLTPEQFADYNTARLVAAAWLLDEAPLPPTHEPDWFGWLPEPSMTLPVYEKLRALPAEEQRVRVAALRAAEVNCDPRDRLQILVGS